MNATIHIVSLPHVRLPRYLVVPDEECPLIAPFLFTIEGLKGEYITPKQADALIAKKEKVLAEAQALAQLR